MAKKNRSARAAKTARQSQPQGGAGLTVTNRYDAAGYGRRMRGWRAPSTGPNAAMAGAETIRNRARDADRNDWQAKSGGRVWTVNLVGTGIIPRWRTKDTAQKSRLSAIWAKWVKIADADGVLDFYGQQALAARTWVTSGECFGRLRYRRASDGLPVPVQLELLESDMCPYLDADVWPGMPQGNRMRSGVEFDGIGRRVAYWFWRQHPGERTTVPGAGELTRIPADQVIHLFEQLRPKQIRGISEFATILAKLRVVGDLDDAVLERQRAANLFAFFITRTAQPADPEIDPTTGRTIVRDRDGTPIIDLQPGSGYELDEGEDVKFSTPPDAGNNYPEFSRQQHLGIAAGANTPYELMTGDIANVSDRTLRVIINEFRRHAEQRQWHNLIPQLCQRVADAWARTAAESGAIGLDEVEAAQDIEWSPQAWPYIHPTQDVQAEKMAVDAGFKSRTRVISQRGDDPEQTDAERLQDAQRDKPIREAEGLSPPPAQTGA